MISYCGFNNLFWFAVFVHFWELWPYFGWTLFDQACWDATPSDMLKEPPKPFGSLDAPSSRSEELWRDGLPLPLPRHVSYLHFRLLCVCVRVCSVLWYNRVTLVVQYLFSCNVYFIGFEQVMLSTSLIQRQHLLLKRCLGLQDENILLS